MAIRTITHSKEVLCVILGGGAGTRLYPLTANRSKPAVPIAGKYRLVDIPISNCLNNGIGRMFVLTQFNSASLNRHIKNTYHFSAFSKAFVDILAAEQTPDNPTWYQGTADAVRQGLRHIEPFESDYVLILSGDQLYRMDFQQLLKTHKEARADVTLAVHAGSLRVSSWWDRAPEIMERVNEITFNATWYQGHDIGWFAGGWFAGAFPLRPIERQTLEKFRGSCNLVFV